MIYRTMNSAVNRNSSGKVRPMSHDLLALGETMLTFAVAPGQSWRRAASVLVDHAGAESNTCVGLARLGRRVAWISRLGMDAAGDRILDALAAEGVDTRWVRRDRRRPTGVMLKDDEAGVRYYRTAGLAKPSRPARAVAPP
jgi:sugar/nucleoside kinase (ribokinase family)